MAMAEVYEVATFYHHFDVVKEGDAPPPAITVRVCDSIACELAGSRELLASVAGAARRRTCACCTRLASAAARRRRSRSSARIRCRTRPPRRSSALVQAGAVKHPRVARSASIVTPGHIDYAAYRAAGGYALAASCVTGEQNRGRSHRGDGRLGPARPRRRRLSRRPQVEDRWRPNPRRA